MISWAFYCQVSLIGFCRARYLCHSAASLTWLIWSTRLTTRSFTPTPGNPCITPLSTKCTLISASCWWCLPSLSSSVWRWKDRSSIWRSSPSPRDKVSRFSLSSKIVTYRLACNRLSTRQWREVWPGKWRPFKSHSQREFLTNLLLSRREIIHSDILDEIPEYIFRTNRFIL